MHVTYLGRGIEDTKPLISKHLKWKWQKDGKTAMPKENLLQQVLAQLH